MNIYRFAGPNDIELSGTTLTVYHRTKNQDIAGSICTIGFIAGSGASYLKDNKGHWKNVPKEIRPLISKTGEAKYWAAALKKSQDNWKYIPPDIASYMESDMDISPPSNLKELQAEGAEERQAETEELEIPDSAISWVQDQISKMNKRAARLGLHPVILEVVSEDRKERTKKIKVMGNVPVLKGNKLMARLEDVEDDQGNISRVVETLSDEVLPSPVDITGKKGTLTVDLETAPLICQHCNMNRRRKEAYIIKRVAENSYLMVASSCLGDYIGELGGAATPDAIAKYASEFRQMLVQFREGNEHKGKSDQQIRKDYKTKGVPIAFFLTKVLSIEKQAGFVGREDAYRTGKDSTAALAWLMCIDFAYDQKYSKPTDASDISLIDSALTWIATIIEPPSTGFVPRQNKFLYSVKKACEIGTVMEKRGKGNASLVAWLPSTYKKNFEEKEDFSKLMGEKGEQIFFKGTMLSKKPVLVQISQQVMTNKNTRQNYCIAESDSGRRVAWMEEKPILADVGKTVFIKGTVDKNGYIDNKSSAHLTNVEEIPEQEYVAHEPEMIQKLSDFEKKHTAEVAKEEIAAQPAQPVQDQPLAGSPQGNYQDGANIVEDYIIMSVRPANRGQSLYFFQDNYGKRVSAFTSLNIGKANDKVRLSATVKLNKGYINLENIKILPMDKITATILPTRAPQPTAFQDDQVYEDDFIITGIKPAAYQSTLYTLKDSFGRSISSFIKAFLGNIGSTIRLQGVIKLKGPYINLTRVRVVPKQAQAPSTPTIPITTMTTPQPASPVQPSPQAQQDQQDQQSTPLQPTTCGHNWYKFASFRDFISGLMGSKKEEDKIDISPITVPEESIQPSQEQTENKRKFKYSHEIDMQKAYDRFKDSYEKATGKAWTFDKFRQRAGNWKFYGDEDGYITVKEQNSGMYKLVGVAGDDSNPLKKGKALVTAMNDILSEGKPVWGMVSSDIKTMLEKFGMKSPPAMLMKSLMKFIPTGVLGGARIGQIFPDGAVELEYSDIGKTTKYFMGNSEYYHKLAQMVESNNRLPKMTRIFLKKMIEQIASSSYFIKISSSSVGVKNYLSIDEM